MESLIVNLENRHEEPTFLIELNCKYSLQTTSSPAGMPPTPNRGSANQHMSKRQNNNMRKEMKMMGFDDRYLVCIIYIYKSGSLFVHLKFS